jgi:uncharacterized membrane protein YfcA
MIEDFPHALLLFLMGFGAWTLSSLAAGGGAITFLPIASFLMPARHIAPVITIASITSSMQRCWLYRRNIHWSIVRANVPGLAVGSFTGAFLLRELDLAWLAGIIGALLLTLGIRHFATELLARRSDASAASDVPSWRPGPLHFGLLSTLTAVLSALVGASGPLMNPLYLRADIVKEDMLGTKAASTLVMQLFKIGAFLGLGLFDSEVLASGVIVAMGAVVGNVVGKYLLGFVSPAIFRHFVYSVLVATGGMMVFRQLAPA